MRPDDPVGAQPAQRLSLHRGLRQRTEDTVHPSGVAVRRNRLLDGLDVLTRGSLLLQRPRKRHLTSPLFAQLTEREHTRGAAVSRHTQRHAPSVQDQMLWPPSTTSPPDG